MVQLPGLPFTQILSAQATLTYIRKVKLLYRVILLIHHAAKHKGDFSPFIISFQLESSEYDCLQ